MNKVIRNTIEQISLWDAWKARVRDYAELTKFRLSFMVVFSAVMAYLIAGEGSVNWIGVSILALGGFLVTGASNALNQVLERDYDKLMKRTANRPVAAGRMSVSEAVMIAGFMSLIGIMALALFNAWTALLGMIALISYAFIYTPFKRVGPIAVFIGAIPGALPMMIGAVAVEGQITLLALTLFGIQFMWQFPHFWAIGWLGHEDYSNAGFKIVPSNFDGKPDRQIGVQSLIYSLFLTGISLMPYAMGITGWLSAGILLILGLSFMYYSWNLYQKADRKSAKQLMFCSLFYLPIALIVLYIDKI